MNHDKHSDKHLSKFNPLYAKADDDSKIKDESSDSSSENYHNGLVAIMNDASGNVPNIMKVLAIKEHQEKLMKEK